MSLKRLARDCEPIFIAKMVFEVDLSVQSANSIYMDLKSSKS